MILLDMFQTSQIEITISKINQQEHGKMIKCLFFHKLCVSTADTSIQ